jgi:hypothetical protein
MADAYWYEYRVHAMKSGDSEIWGNTERAQHRDGFATNVHPIESIRLGVWPR